MSKLSQFVEDASLGFALGALLLLASGAARSAERPLATTEGAAGYSTELEAAQEALKVAAEQSTTLEQAGGIVLKGGLYYPTNAVSNSDAGHFSIRIRLSGKLVAIYHTHPGRDGTADAFSRDDRDVAKSMQVHSYIRAIESGAVYLLVGDRATQLGGHSLCHGIECKDYYALVRHQVAVLYGQARSDSK